MNVALDGVIFRMIKEPGYLQSAQGDAEGTAAWAGVDAADINAAVNGDIGRLFASGAHPLLLMKLAGALGIDPMDQFDGRSHVHSATER